MQPSAPSARSGRLLPVAALMGSMISIQFGATFGKSLFPIVGSQGTTALRLAVGAMMLTLALRAWRVRPSKKVLPYLFAHGVNLGVMNLSFYASLKYIPLGVAVSLEFVGPLLLSVALSRHRIDFVWAGLAMLGIVLLTPIVSGGDSDATYGVFFALFAGACWALYILLSQRVGKELGTQASAIGLIIAAVVALPFGIAEAGPALIQPGILFGALVVGLFSSALPFWLEMVALNNMPARAYGTITSLEPAIGAAMGFLLLHETLGAGQPFGIALVVVAALGTAATMKPPVRLPE